MQQTERKPLFDFGQLYTAKLGWPDAVIERAMRHTSPETNASTNSAGSSKCVKQWEGERASVWRRVTVH